MLLLLTLLLPATDPPMATLFVKVGPNALVPGRSVGQERAVVLIHGLGLHPFSKEKVTRAALRTWQQSTSPLVHALARSADVYAFAYAQTLPVEKVADAAGLGRAVRRLKAEGYRDIVLIGHSAGGLIARHLVEDDPGCGVTRVIQVNCPNTGSALAALTRTARDVQTAFLASLSKTAREKVLATRADKKVPAGVSFACVVGSLRLGGDGIVSCRSQWSDDLQRQGVPAFVLRGGHRDALTTASGVELLAKLVRDPLPRWDRLRVDAVRKVLGLTR